ncbi:MAG: hypothetical protein AMJ88_11180 [Anaerolineae bacterium SM23_ 63]|nr:MAG: hypothetical protein AMJ88_11180 [Anaerolineae bacterium SM23_ 63]HEY47087.1 hypothetical protein [Anaerolineae bacterium]
MNNIFPILILNARPAAGKSEISHYLKHTPLDERIERFHVGPIHSLDDFPLLWAWLEEDKILEHILDRPRLHTTPDEDFLHHDFWHLLIRRLSLNYDKWRRDARSECTAVIEFSRGKEHGGYRAAYQHLSDAILRKAACLYVQVSYEESLRKNRRRQNPERPDSILEHSLADQKMEHLYHEDDWADFTSDSPTHLTVRGIQVPYVIFENEDDVTTARDEALGTRLETVLDRLWTLREG